MVTPARHLSLSELGEGFAALPAPLKDTGHLAFIVCRHAPGIHEPLERTILTCAEGLPGDEWNRRPPKNPDAQLTAMRRDVAALIGGGEPLTVSGDNLFVDLDLSAGNLPVGTRLRIGEALVEVTIKAHNGCQKFQRRFGEDALRFVQEASTRHFNLRGIYWRVVEAGEIAVDCPIQVLSRPEIHSAIKN